MLKFYSYLQAFWFSILLVEGRVLVSHHCWWSVSQLTTAKKASWSFQFIQHHKYQQLLLSRIIQFWQLTQRWNIQTVLSWSIMRLSMTYAGVILTLRDHLTQIWIDLSHRFDCFLVSFHLEIQAILYNVTISCYWVPESSKSVSRLYHPSPHHCDLMEHWMSIWPSSRQTSFHIPGFIFHLLHMHQWSQLKKLTMKQCQLVILRTHALSPQTRWLKWVASVVIWWWLALWLKCFSGLRWAMKHKSLWCDL